MRNAIICATLTLGLAACGGNPCDDYVDALCDCLDEESCEDTKTTYEGADSDLKDECSSKLDEAEEAAKTCEVDEGGSDSGGA